MAINGEITGELNMVIMNYFQDNARNIRIKRYNAERAFQ